MPKADFVNANLSDANLNGAYLREANFHKADLFRTNFEGADLYKAILTKTKNLRSCDLDKVKTLFNAKLDQRLEKELRKKKPELFKMPEWLRELESI